MYHLLLTRRYLTTKILPFLATLAVLLSTATVIIAWSIMTGFLGVLLDSGRTLVGDVMIVWPQAGFGHYEELIEDLEKDPTIKAAAPVIEVFGLIKLPDNRQRLASVKGIDPRFSTVTGFEKSIWWKPLDEPLPKDKEGRDPRLVPVASFVTDRLPALVEKMKSTVTQVRDLAKSRNAPAEVVAGLDERLRALEEVPNLGRAAIALRPNSDERREKTVAFLEAAAGIVRGVDQHINTMMASNLVTQADLDASPGADVPSINRGLASYEWGLQPIAGEYMRLARAYANAATLSATDPVSGERVPGMVIGVEFTDFNQRFVEGYYIPRPDVLIRQPDGEYAQLAWAVGDPLPLNVMPLDSAPTAMDIASQSLPVVNEMRSGLFEFDKSWVLVELETLQKMVRMQAAEEVEPHDPWALVEGPNGLEFAKPKVLRETPARVTHVLVRGQDGTDLLALRARCREIYEAFAERHPHDVPMARRINITTWEEERSTLVGAVKKEIVMVLLILGVVSLTVSFLILAIFWAIVREKTKDIGILRAVGASRLSVLGLWLEYALITGLLGSLLGGLAGCVIVWNINPIHDWLGRNLGLVIWDPRIYYFFEIPNKVDPMRAVLVMVAGVGFAVLGALIPAIRAAYMDPVRSLRFE